MVLRAGLEPATQGFSVPRSTDWSYHSINLFLTIDDTCLGSYVPAGSSCLNCFITLPISFIEDADISEIIFDILLC